MHYMGFCPVHKRTTWVHPDIAKNILDTYMPSGLVAPASADKTGLVYAITSDLVNVVKIGRWSGSTAKLASRYTTYYGDDLEIMSVRVEDSPAEEVRLHEKLTSYHISGELFEKNCWQAVLREMGRLRHHRDNTKLLTGLSGHKRSFDEIAMDGCKDLRLRAQSSLAPKRVPC
ncbi:hypothetical protein WJX74_001579 [Apatococcus lobatus]|uniref:GIY-YIG nuclease family protein n=1 Tax=Apatococcus lobatus TaxID=904363 RepID=A0AAW1RCZ2_9CHLO